MKVYLVQVCCDEEYGCMETVKVFANRDEAYYWAHNNGFQNLDPGKGYARRADYFTVGKWNVD